MDAATGLQLELLQAVKKKMGKVPNILGTMAHAPTVLQTYLSMSEALGQSSLPAALRERLALAIAEKNDCSYCLAAHTVIGKMNGLTEEETLAARHGEAADPRDAAALTFALRVLETNGFLTEADREAAAQAGLEAQQQIEIVGIIALNLLTNLFNHVADTDIDFPPAPSR